MWKHRMVNYLENWKKDAGDKDNWKETKRTILLSENKIESKLS